MENNQEQDSKKELLSQVLTTKELIEYQKNAIVSKTLINKKAGTLTLFAFDEGERLSEHTAPFDALVYVLDGEAEIIISGSAFIVKENEIIIMPAHQSHAVNAIHQFKMMLVMIKE